MHRSSLLVTTLPLALARKRARLRKQSAGAAMFIVAVTLGMLATMGAYALASASNDVRAAGHVRESMQGQRTAELAMMATAEAFAAVSAGPLVHKARNTRVGDLTARSMDCKSSKPPTTLEEFRDAEACVKLTPEQLSNIALAVNKFNNPTTPVAGCTTPANCALFEGGPTGSFGPINTRPDVTIEVTNPIDIPPPPGMGLDNGTGARMTYVQLTATVYAKMAPSKNDPASTVSMGRGRMTVGPIFGTSN